MLANTLTIKRLDSFAKNPSHALILHGQAGSGAQKLAENILESMKKHTLRLQSEKGKAIGIESIRAALEFLKIKGGERALLISDADKMSEESQNALLKTLEEPVVGTIIILISENPEILLPTIRSRANSLEVLPVGLTEIMEAYPDKDKSELQRVLLLSGGAAELSEALIMDSDHQLLEEIEVAKSFLKSITFEKLAQVDKLKDSAESLSEALRRIARSTLQSKALNNSQRKRWMNIYELAVQADRRLKANVGKKSVLLELALALNKV